MKPALLNGIEIGIPNDCQVLRAGYMWTIVRVGIAGLPIGKAVSKLTFYDDPSKIRSLMIKKETTKQEPCRLCLANERQTFASGRTSSYCKECAASIKKTRYEYVRTLPDWVDQRKEAARAYRESEHGKAKRAEQRKSRKKK